MLIHPSASFLVAAIGCGIITWANSLAFPGSTPNFFIQIGFFLLALFAWLVTSSLQDAMRKLRLGNAELDILVRERTSALAIALERQQIEAGQGKAILDSIADGILFFDKNGAATTANPACLRLLEIPPEKMVGKTLQQLGQSKALDEHNRRLFAGLLDNPGEPQSHQPVEWGKKTLSITSAPVHNQLGASLGSVVVFRDCTSQAEVERMKSTILAFVSHELRTPLQAILGYVEMLKDASSGPLSLEKSQVCDKITKTSNRLLEISNDLIDQAQMEAVRLSPGCSALPAGRID